MDERTFTEDEIVEALGDHYSDLKEHLSDKLGVGNLTEYKVSVRIPEYSTTGMWSATFLNMLESEFIHYLQHGRNQDIELTVEVIGGNTTTARSGVDSSIRRSVSRKFSVGYEA